MGINRVTLIGHIGNDIEVKQVNNEAKVAKFTFATSETFKINGEKKTFTEWHNIECWKGLADIAEKYFKKGQQLFIEGKIKYNSYEKDGQKKYFTSIIAQNIQMLDSKKENNKNNLPSTSVTNIESKEGSDDLPF